MLTSVARLLPWYQPVRRGETQRRKPVSAGLLPPGAASCSAVALTFEIAPRQNLAPAVPRRNRREFLENSSIESANATSRISDTIKEIAVSFEDGRAFAGESDHETNLADEEWLGALVWPVTIDEASLARCRPCSPSRLTSRSITTPIDSSRSWSG